MLILRTEERFHHDKERYSMNKQRIIGVIGGMGPLATVNFYQILIQMTNVEKDQDHPRVIIDSNPAVPDRTKAILGQGPSSAPVIIEIARTLQNAGADFLAMPCVTAHYFYDEIQAAIDIPLIHMIRETANIYTEKFPGKKAGLLSTSGTQKASIFQSTFPSDSILIPDEDTQTQLVMPAIYGVKSGDSANAKPKIIEAAQRLIQHGADLAIAGCTEVPIILKSEDIPIPLLDPVHVLAECCLRLYFAKK